ncbi:MAG: hypothetical protein ACYCO3_03395 [Mycobacteriales bacterium]
MLLFALLGFELGWLGAFLVPVVLPGGVEGLSVLVAVAGNLAAGWSAALGTGRPVGAASPAVGWFLAVLFAATTTSNSSLIVPSSIPGEAGSGAVVLAFLVLGALAAIVAVAWQPRRIRG